MNDQLEYALALRFAPEWRFNRWQPGDGSDQNSSEIIYPISVQDWFDQVVAGGDQPQLYFPWDVVGGFPVGQSVDILDINELSSMVNPYTGIPVSMYDGASPLGEVHVKMHNYPDGMTGDPDDFPTYFRCYPYNDNDVRLCYILWYPYDEKSTPFDFAEHQADWAGITISLSGISDILDPTSVTEAQISYVWYGGHGAKKYIYPYSTSYMHLGDHPMVFVSRGAHACFPRSGEWHNWNEWFGEQYDDMFSGRGLVVQSWNETRDMINLGEHSSTCPECLPLVGWLTYRGQWGPDGDPDGSSSSPNGPASKKEWNGHIAADVLIWEQNVALHPAYTEPFEPLAIDHDAGWFSDLSEPGIVFWNSYAWSGPELFISGPQEYSDISSIGFGLGANSALFLGDVRLRLYTGLNFTGTEVIRTRSSPDFGSGYQSMIVERGDGTFTCDQVVDYQNTSGFEDGSWANPYSTVEEAVNAAVAGQHICIRAGDYPENFIGAGYINKQVTFHSYFGTAKIGD